MPLLFHQQFSDSEIAVWKISEDENFFRSNLKLSDDENNFLSGIKASNKKLEWLASRHLLRVLLKTELFIDSNFQQRGKPQLLNHEKEISISHSSGVCAVIISDSKNVGLDIEPLTRNVSAIAHKFISEEEKQNRILSNDEMLFIWCGKEALFKYYSKGQVDFIDDLFVELDERINSGTVNSSIRKSDMNISLPLHYLILNEEYLLCWVK